MTVPGRDEAIPARPLVDRSAEHDGSTQQPEGDRACVDTGVDHEHHSSHGERTEATGRHASQIGVLLCLSADGAVAAPAASPTSARGDEKGPWQVHSESHAGSIAGRHRRVTGVRRER